MSGALSHCQLPLPVTATDKNTDKVVSGYIKIDHNRQTVTGYSERGDNGLSPSEMLAAGWLACWPWLLVSPDLASVYHRD